MAKQGSGDGIPSSFKRATTDEQRVEIVYKHLGLDVNQTMDSLGKFKCADQSTTLRLEGNAFFAKKTPLSLHVAIMLYSKSISFAPYPKSPKDKSQELSFGFANRSAALFTLGYYEECLTDIDRALGFGYPDNLKYKLLERRVRCQSFLGISSDINKSIEEALGALSLAELSNERMESLKASISNPKDTNTKCCFSKPYLSKPPPKSYGENAKMPSASDCLELTYSTEMGRGLTATRDIDPGDIVIVEKPFAAAFIVNTTEPGCEVASHTHCYNCMERVQGLVPCKYCPMAMYCTETCRETSWDMYHRYECTMMVMLQTLPFEGNIFLLLRILLISTHKCGGLEGLYKVVKEIEKDKNQIKGLNKEGKYDSSDYATVHNLLTHTKSRSNTNLFIFAVYAATLTRTLDTFTDFFAQVKKCPPPKGGARDWKMFVGGLLLRYMQVMVTNSCGIADFVEGPEDKEMIKIKYAHGLYPTSSMTNHSCNPNILSHLREGNVRAVMAVRSIKKGEQLFNAANCTYIGLDRTKRRNFIREQLYFTCECEACTNSWATPTMIDKVVSLVAPDATWRCAECGAELPAIPRSWRRPPETFVHVCKRCKSSYNNGGLKTKLQDIAVGANIVFLMIRNGKGIPEDLRGPLAEQLIKLEKLVMPPHPLAVSIQENLLQNFMLLGNYYRF